MLVLYISLFFNTAFLLALIFILRERKKIQKVAYLDFLTGLLNKRGLEFFLKSILNPRYKGNRKYNILVCYVDLNNFKKINDKFGHYKGDVLLASIGKIFKSFLREGDIACRIGGDEFILLFLDNDNSIKYNKILERIERKYKEVLEKNHLLKIVNNNFNQLFAVGCAQSGEVRSIKDFYEVVNIAEENMRKNKKGGR